MGILALSSILTALILCFLMAQFVRLQIRRKRFPPGPTPLPYIGNFWQLKFFRLSRELLTEEAKTYGNIFTLWFGTVPAVILVGFQAVKDGLTTRPEDMVGRPQTPYFKALANNKGIFLTTAKTWKNQRRVSLMILRTLGLGKRSFEYQVQEEACNLVEAFRNTKGKPMNPSYAITLAVANVICSVVFGHRFSNDDKTFHGLLEAMECLFTFFGCFMHHFYELFPWLLNHIPGRHQKALSSRDFVHSFIRREIKKHLDSDVPDEPQDFIDFYLAQIDRTKSQPSPPYDEKNMVHCIFDLFLGGTETSSTTLHWALLYMVLYPDVQAKVQKEIDTVLAPGQMIYYEDRKNLPYTNAVIHEIQRFSNIVAVGVPKCCVRDTTIREFFIEKGTIIFPILASALYDSSEWERPLNFNPSHFLDKDGNFTCRDAFIPFSLGHRTCVGDHLARTELFLFFSSLLQAFTFHLAEGSKDITVEAVWGGTLQPHYFEICATPR
ncbi:cytochrome P450 2J4-like [Elgaria multicarinata webbii]|uniref:cytochrome P450 2J4-like n=1 Tax=Elgaria multicarinata webbii TaxID=159646 RepID=UPI002FCD2807